MSTSKSKIKLPVGLQAVEILHIDTAKSQEFFAKLKANNSEKCDCQKILFDLLSECCQHNGGYAVNWQGDGGHAIFPALHKSGNSIAAARDFISKLPLLTLQTATILGRQDEPDLVRREFRIQAHFGLVRLSGNHQFDAGDPAEFDAFLKNEKKLAPHTNELFITEQLYKQLGGVEKSQFNLHTKEATYGALTTAIYRLQITPTNHGRRLLSVDAIPKNITDSDLSFLITYVESQWRNVKARNSITIGLMNIVLRERRALRHNDFTSLTMRALFNYLGSIYPSYKFSLALWLPTEEDRTKYLDKIAIYPAEVPMVPRRVPLADVRFQMVRAYVTCNPVVTPCVTEARLAGEWIDFDESQSSPSRGLISAIQLPIYSTQNKIGDVIVKERLGVLSIDTDKLDFFINDELDLWTEDLVGYLANLALGEHMRQAGFARRAPGEVAT